MSDRAGQARTRQARRVRQLKSAVAIIRGTCDATLKLAEVERREVIADDLEDIAAELNRVYGKAAK